MADARIVREGRHAMLAEDSLGEAPTVAWFDAVEWRREGASELDTGRGAVLISTRGADELPPSIPRL